MAPRVAGNLASTFTDTTVTMDAPAEYTYRVWAVSPSGDSAAAGPLTVQLAASTTTLASSANPSTYGQTVTFTATVASALPGEVPTGTVAFALNGGTFEVPLSGGIATLTTSALPAVNVSVTASYSGTPTGAGGVMLLPSIDGLLQQVSKAASTIALTSDVASTIYGGSVTFTATVGPAGTTGTATFTFDKGRASEVSKVASVVGGVATYTTSSLTVGEHSVEAVYSGDASYLPGTSNVLSQTVTALATTTVVTSNRNPSIVGDSVSLLARVTQTSTGNPVTVGVVTIRVTNVGAPDTVLTVALSSQGRGVLTTTALAAGTHTVTATYNGTLPYAGSVSDPLAQVVNKRTSTVSLTRTPTSSVFGQAVTFRATTNDPSAGGTVTFTIDGTRNVTVTLDNNGEARMIVSNLTVGTHTVRARYDGSALYAPSTSTTISHTVARASSSTQLVSSLNPANRGQRVTFTATVSAVSPGLGVPTGRVRFYIDGLLVADLLMNQAGRAAISTSTLSVGNHTVRAQYLGSGNFTSSNISTLTQRIR